MKNTLDNLVSAKRMPVLFVGSGISKRYLYKYPNWNELLRLSFEKVNPDPFYFQKNYDQLSRSGLSDFEINTSLATIIENDFNAAFFDRKIKLNIGNPKNPTWAKRGISPYKMFLSSFFKKMTLNRNPQLSEEIKKFRLLKNKVSAVITTNYDSFLEKEIFNSDFKVFTHQNELFSADSYNIAEIYKIHGSASDASSIVITKHDYDLFFESRKLIIAKMMTLFAESPIVFLGYSFTDENIQSIITEFLSCLTDVELKDIAEHFIFISYKKGEFDLHEVKRTITTVSGDQIPITEIETDNYSKVFDVLNQITPGISPVRIRETKKIVKTIVDQSVNSSDAESLIVGIDDINELNLSNKPLAIAIGYKENILNKLGYGLLSVEMIFEDIIFDNKHFNAQEMCEERFKSISISRLYPVFKYIKHSDQPLDPNSKLWKYAELHNSVEKIISNNITKTLSNLPDISDIDKLVHAIDNVDGINKQAGILLKNITHFSLPEIRNVCKVLFNINPASINSSTNFKRCVMYLDLKENYTPIKKKS